MSKAVQLRIAEPCHQNWHAMTPKEQGRFCGSCQKTVGVKNVYQCKVAIQ